MGDWRFYEFGDYRLDVRERRLLFRGARITLTGKQFALLLFLVKNPGRLLSREALSSGAWPGATVSPGTVNVHLSALKTALGNKSYKELIENERGEGYRFKATVTPIPEAPTLQFEQRRLTTRVTYEEEEIDGGGFPSRGVLAPAIDEALRLDPLTSNVALEQPSALVRASGNPQGQLIQAREAPYRASQRPPSLSVSNRQADEAQAAPLPLESNIELASRDSRFFRFSLKGVLIVGLVVTIFALWRWKAIPAMPTVSGFTELTYDGLKKSDGGPLLTDGSRVYFREYRGDGLVLVSVPAVGGDVDEVHVPPGFAVSDVSKGGSEYLGSDRAPDGVLSLAIVSASGKSLQWLPQPRAPASGGQWIPNALWSPHRNRISFSLPGEVLEAEIDSGRIRKIAHVDGWPIWPRWSPDGSKLVFSVLKPKEETFSLWGVNADGSHLHRFSFAGSGFTEACWGSWTPNGKWLVFEAERSGRRDIWAIPEVGGLWSRTAKPLRLTSGPLNYFWPVSSLDGKDIFVLGETTRGELMRFDLKSRSFVDFLGGISATEVSFSRDGKRVAYVTYPDYTLWSARADGSDAHQITYPPLQAREPRWSPDGRQIAFQGITRNASSTAPRYKIYLVSSRGGIPQEAVMGSGEESVGTWWPDGHALLYDQPLFRHEPSQTFLYRLDLKTRKSFRIPGSSGSWTARLSPDGRYIVTLDATWNAHPQHVFVLDTVTGQRILNLAIDSPAEPTWSLDGKYIYFAVISSPTPALYRVKLSDKKLEKITTLSGFPVAGLWTGVAPDGSPLLLRDTSTEEIYSLHVRWH